MWKAFINAALAAAALSGCAAQPLWERSEPLVERSEPLWEESEPLGERSEPSWERSPDRDSSGQIRSSVLGRTPFAKAELRSAEIAPTVAVPAPEVLPRNAEAFARATALLEAGRLVEAEALLLEVTDDQPELAGPWVNLSQVFLAQQRDDDALAALSQAVLANPGNCAARTEIGVLLRRRGEFEAAEAHYLACLAHQPDHGAAHLNLGILYELYLGRLHEALGAYRRYQALAAEPDRRVEIWVVDLQRRLDS